jgi:hypothetical protein
MSTQEISQAKSQTLFEGKSQERGVTSLGFVTGPEFVHAPQASSFISQTYLDFLSQSNLFVLYQLSPE